MMTARVLKYYRVYALGVIALLASGSYSYLQLPRNEDPEFDVAACLVVTRWPGVTTTKIEELVTRTLEERLKKLENIGLVESASSPGLSVIDINIDAPGIPGEVIEEVEQAVRELHPTLPDGVLPPRVLSFNTSGIPVVIAALQGSLDYNQLKAWADQLEDDLLALDGVESVKIEGMPDRQIQILGDNARLSQYRIPLRRIRDVIAGENAAIPGGHLDVGTRRFILETPNEYDSLEALEETVIRNTEDSLVELRDVATVIDGFADHSYLVRTNRQPALLLAVNKKSRTDTIAVANAIVAQIHAFEHAMPPGVKLTIISNRGAAVDELLSNLEANAFSGGLIVILVTTFFLGLRQAIVVSLAIPLSLFVAFLLLDTMSLDLNQVSIFGLVLALGMLVDSALVVVESIAQQLEKGRPLFRSVVSGVGQVQLAVLSSGLTTMAAFIPLIYLTGDIGEFIYSLPLVVIFAMTGSVVVAFTVVPLLCYAMWKRFPPVQPAFPAPSKFLGYYLKLVKMSLRHRAFTLLIAGLALAIAVSVIPRLGVQFFPKADKRFFLLNIRLPRDVNLDTTTHLVRRVEELLAREASIDNFTTNIGKGSPRLYYNELRENENVNYAQVVVNLSDNFSGSVDNYVDNLGAKFESFSDASIEPKILEQGPQTGAAIQLRIRGDDLETLSDLATIIRHKIADIPGIADVRDTMGAKVPRLKLNLDKHEAALLGISTFTFSHSILTALEGQVASHYRNAGDTVPIVVKLDPRSMRNVNDLHRLYLPSDFGTMVSLADVSTISQEQDFFRINRRNGRRSVTVEAETRNRLVNDVVQDIQTRLAHFDLPAGYTLEYGGENEERDQSFSGLWRALMLAVLFIYAILSVQFNSFVQPFVILLTVPFGVIGAVLGLFITGNPFGFMAFVGIVSLTGIIINDSIVLTDYANYLQRVEKKSVNESLLEAGTRRFRPVVLTSLTTIGGLLPLAFWGGSLWAPLASALIFGLGCSTVLILIVLPVIYSVVARQKERHRVYHLSEHLWEGIWRKELPAD